MIFYKTGLIHPLVLILIGVITIFSFLIDKSILDFINFILIASIQYKIITNEKK